MALARGSFLLAGPALLFWLAQAGGPSSAPGVGHVSECDQATAALRGLYDEVRACIQDSECNYIADFYEVVPRTEDRFVTSFNCQEVTPFLVVAAGSKVEQRLQDLLAARERQQSACDRGDVTCLGFAVRQTNPPPVCLENQCQAPSVDQPQ